MLSSIPRTHKSCQHKDVNSWNLGLVDSWSLGPERPRPLLIRISGGEPNCDLEITLFKEQPFLERPVWLAPWLVAGGCLRDGDLPC